MKRKEYRIAWCGAINGSTIKHSWNSALKACKDQLPEGEWVATAKRFHKDEFGNHAGGCWHFGNSKGDTVWFQLTKMNDAVRP